MTSSFRKRASPAGKKRHVKARQRRISLRRRRVPLGGNRSGSRAGLPSPPETPVT
ncbi:MAG TPA: hypothetical protein VGP88_04135 [Thermoplasmata archaeon]|nr:hypothetical protein [Thermoplasmata archaeon]